jgi:hypothetical protein
MCLAAGPLASERCVTLDRLTRAEHFSQRALRLACARFGPVAAVDASRPLTRNSSANRFVQCSRSNASQRQGLADGACKGE